jgi:hypothetical protein
VRKQIEVQGDRPNPVSFTSPDATKFRVWLASNKDGDKIIGVDRLWRVNIEELQRQKKERRAVRL